MLNGPISGRTTCLDQIVEIAMEQYETAPPVSEADPRRFYMRKRKMVSDRCIGEGRDRLFAVLHVMAADVRLGKSG